VETEATSLPIGTLLMSDHFRGSFVSTKYPGSSEGTRLKRGYAVVIAAALPHHFIVAPMPGNVLIFGWILNLARWQRLT